MRSGSSKTGNLRLILVTVLVLFSIALVAANVRAPNYSGEASVPAGEHWFQRFEVESLNHFVTDDLVEIYYRFRVRSGPNVDFLLFTEENYTRYVSGENTTYIQSFTWLNDDRAGGTPYLEPGVYYFVVDNSEYGEAVPSGETVTFEYEISYSDPETYQSRMLLLVLIPAIVLAVIVVVVIWLTVRHGSERKESVKRS